MNVRFCCLRKVQPPELKQTMFDWLLARVTVAPKR